MSTLMGRKVLAAALILIACGLILILLHDPQFQLIFTSSSSNLRSGSAGSSFPIATSGGVSNGGTTVAYNALDIIESLVGAGFVGIGLVFIAIEIAFRTPQTRAK